MIKSLDPQIEIICIKPPAKRSISKLVKYADISMNKKFETIKLLSNEVKIQKKTHKIIIMVELGQPFTLYDILLQHILYKAVLA